MNLQLLVNEVKDYVDKRLNNYIEELKYICAIDTYTYHKPGLDTVAEYSYGKVEQYKYENKYF